MSRISFESFFLWSFKAFLKSFTVAWDFINIFTMRLLNFPKIIIENSLHWPLETLSLVRHRIAMIRLRGFTDSIHEKAFCVQLPQTISFSSNYSTKNQENNSWRCERERKEINFFCQVMWIFSILNGFRRSEQKERSGKLFFFAVCSWVNIREKRLPRLSLPNENESFFLALRACGLCLVVTFIANLHLRSSKQKTNKIFLSIFTPECFNSRHSISIMWVCCFYLAGGYF